MSEVYDLRAGGPGDCAETGALAIELGYPAYGPAALRAALDGGRGILVLAGPQGSRSGEPGSPGVLGFALFEVVADEAELHLVAVRASARRSGWGRGLLAAGEARVAARGAARVFLEVAETNRAARALYRASGYAQVGMRERYYPDGASALVLRRSLDLGRTSLAAGDAQP